MRAAALAIGLLGICFGVGVLASDKSPTAPSAPAWSAKAAAAYMDGRMTWWIGWDRAARDHHTFCVSCHTVLPYAMARPALRTALEEQSPSSPERQVLENVTKRVRMWSQVVPFYPDEKAGAGKSLESRGTESVMNALILVGYDAPTGKLSADARLALDNMWAEQLKTGAARGAWNWLQFHNAPWEGDSQYYGATLAAIALGTTPPSYRTAPELRGNIGLLRDYLVREGGSQILLDRVMLLWASTKLHGLLTPDQQKSIVAETLARQRADGGFSLSSFVGTWKRKDNTPLETKSDGYATGLVALSLEEAGIKRDQPQLRRALNWLAANQEKTDGRWLAYSLNEQRDLSSYIGELMSDAATAYAVLALQHGN